MFIGGVSVDINLTEGFSTDTKVSSRSWKMDLLYVSVTTVISMILKLIYFE